MQGGALPQIPIGTLVVWVGDDGGSWLQFPARVQGGGTVCAPLLQEEEAALCGQVCQFLSSSAYPDLRPLCLCRFDMETKKVICFVRIPMDQINKIIIGVLCT